MPGFIWSPAWSHFRDRMSPVSLLLVDDTARTDERAIVNGWASDGLRIIHDDDCVALDVT